MTPSRNTGPTVPAWIRERIAEYERSWPLAVLGAGLAMAVILTLAMGALIWSSSALLYYARP